MLSDPIMPHDNQSTGNPQEGLMKQLFIIDLMAQFFRSHMAMERNPLTTGDGMIVSGIHGVLRALLRIQTIEEPESILVVTDCKEPTFRHELYPDYKGTRPKMPEEMAAQIPLLYEILALMGMDPLRLPGFEADDIMATIALKARDAGREVFIVSSDKDLMQVVGENLYLYKTGRKGEVILVGPEGVREKFGVRPDQVIDVLALMGDSSDNVPGVPRVGEKTAGKLISEYETLEGVYENLEDHGKKALRRYLEENRELAFLSRQLVTIDCEVPGDWPIESVQLPNWGAPGLSDKLLDLGLRSILEESRRLQHKVDSAAGTESAAPSLKQDYHCVGGRKAFAAFLEKLRAATDPEGGNRLCAFDLETTGLDPLDCEIVGFSFAWEEGEAWYLPVLCPDADRLELEDPPSLPEILAELKPWFENPRIRKCGQNAKYDINVLSLQDVHVEGVEFDSMLASFVLRPSGRQHGLDALSLHYFDYRKMPTSELIGSGRKQISMADVPLEKITFYAAEDADFTLRLVSPLLKELEEAGLDGLFREIDMQVMAVLCRMEQEGVSLDREELATMSAELEEKLADLESEIHDMAGEQFNLNSPRQLATILFEKLHLKPGKKTKSGYSTDVRELERLAKTEPLPARLLDYRQLSKLKSTYVDALPQMLNRRSGRIHTNFNQTIAATGRLSSTEPNLQNIPIRTELGKRIRSAFVTRDRNHVLIDADYSQIELRVLAHVSQDPELLASYNENADLHSRTAAKIFGVEEELVSEEMRRKAKAINFGVIYGMGAFALGGHLEIPVKEAASFISAYFELYSGVRQWIDGTLEKAREDGFVSNLFGRRRYLPEINSDNRQLREATERIATNTPIQGSAADLIKKAMLRLDRRIREDVPELRMISQVHDELLFEAPRERAEELAGLVQHEMEHAVELKVPLVAEAHIGDNWREAH